MKRTIGQVMTTDVVVTRPETSFKDAVRLLRAAGVSALPVVDEADRLIGIVSEADLLVKEAGENPGGWFGRIRRRREARKAAGVNVSSVMTAPVITVSPGDTLATAARVMHAKGLKRLPVVEAGGRIVGIISRQDLIRIYLRSDDEIRNDVVRDVLERAICIDPRTVRVVVADGVVTLEGRLETKSLTEILVSLVQATDGVVGVAPRLSYEVDDTRLRPEATLPWGVLPTSLRYPGPHRAGRRSQ